MSAICYDWDGKPISIEQWGALQAGDKHVCSTLLRKGRRGRQVHVSTIWLGLNLSALREGPPMIFETMIFGGPLRDCVFRYATKGQAKAGHARVVMEVQRELRKPPRIHNGRKP